MKEFMNRLCTNEIWRDVDGYEGEYKVSNQGVIMSYKNPNNPKIIYQQPDRYGYLYAALSHDGIVQYHKVHRIVAKAFVENDDPSRKTAVDHLNKCKYDNRAENLEWVTTAENNRRISLYESQGDITRRSQGRMSCQDESRLALNLDDRKLGNIKPVACYNLKGELLYIFASREEAAKALKIDKTYIGDACNGKLQTYKDHVWKDIPKCTDIELNELRRSYNMSDESIKKIILPSFKKRCAMVDKDGVIVKIYESTSDAERDMKFPTGCLNRVCRGERSSYKGTRWIYITDDSCKEGSIVQVGIFHNTNGAKPIVAKSQEGRFLGLFESQEEAYYILGINKSRLNNALKNNTLYKGVYWWYYNCSVQDINIERSKLGVESIDVLKRLIYEYDRLQARKIEVRDMDDNIVGIYDTIKQLKETMHIDPRTIHRAIDTNQPYKGYYYSYVENID